MNAILALGILTCASSMSMQTVSEVPPLAVERLCGVVLDAGPSSTVNGSSAGSVPPKRLRDVPVRVYSAKKNRPCCDSPTVASTLTSRKGTFQFKLKSIPEGNYWLQVESEGQKNQMMIHYQPKQHSDQVCSETFWQLDKSGNLIEGQMKAITVY